MRLIDADAAVDAVLELNVENRVSWVDAVIDMLDEMPTAQPEIVRCKDCKYQEKFFHEDKRRKEGGYYIFGCELADGYSHVCLDDDFCSRAERREENNG